MISADELELRILTGLHRGARAPVADGAWLGSDADCDIVLSDPGIPSRAGRIRIAGRTWRFDEAGEASSDAAVASAALLEPGATLRLGRVRISVAPAAAPWPDAAALSALPDLTPATLPLAAAHGAKRRATRRQKPYRRAAAYAMMAGTVLAVVAGTRMFWTHATANAMPASLQTVELDRAARQAAAVLDSLALSSDAQVHQQGDDPVTVTGWVRSDVEYARLAEALGRIHPRPALKVEIATVQIRAAQNLLKDFLLRSNVQYLGSGRLTIQGVAANAERRTAAVQTLEAKLAGVSVETHGIVLLQTVTDDLRRAVNAVRLPDLPLEWADDALAIDTTRLDAHQLQVLYPLVTQFNKTHFNSVQPMEPPAPPADPEPTLPFRITSVVGGPHPWLLLSCGTKLLVGGTYANYQLESIAKDKIVFRGPDALITIQR